MTLSDEQKSAISQWIEGGASLSEIQKRLKEEFQISLTYLETRLLADDLKLAFKEPEPEPAVDQPLPPPEPEVPAEAPGKVTVTIDQITRPGSIISGRVTFSDGEKAEWYLDQMGRLGLNANTPGYRPSQDDVMSFQMELEKAARGSGL
ncbi:hypothetical protein TSACC_2360 [Terrimicrobium sacchariphilum]|jgi:hypothetical protein|uniref:Uncharacterized protein n=1 Tax=Terrimicrobium sacchariphilum TaxID=690879 RepID=A0A146G3A7_TERSA|nr:hypothetical protein [Terrimicrobium sacchariphilum]GAT31963.1 hypothetical protein TSACC_2360 [Terrimicrobium sacchariphilum]